jgi:branched-chain amino acid transport system substrate-binding protein
MPRPKLIAGFLLAAALLAAACGSGDDSSTDDTSGSGSMPAGEPIVVGLDEDSTSAGAAYSMVTAEAIRDVVDKVNDEGGVLGRPLQLVVGNSESDPTKGSAVARSLIDQGAVAIFTTAGSSATIQMKPVLQETQTIAIAPTASSAALIEQPNADFVYTMAPSAASWVPTYCGAFEELGVSRVGVITESTPVIDALNNDLLGGIAECAEIVAREGASPDATDVTAQVTRVRNADPDVILVSTSGGSYEILVQNTVAQVIPDLPRFTLYTLANQPDEWRTANTGALDGLLALASIDNQNPATQEAQAFFESIRGDDFIMNAFEAQAYDSVYVLKDAIEQAGGTDDPVAINTALQALSDYTPHYGLTGLRLSFGPDKHNAPDGECGILLAEFTASNELGDPWDGYQPSC